MKTKCIALVVAFLCSTSALAKESLVLYTSQPSKDAQRTVKEFKIANPGIEVDWVRDGTTKLMTKLRAEIAAGVLKPDVLLIADMVTMESLKQEEQLSPYKSPQASNYAKELYDADGYYYSTKLITTGIVYNTKAKEHPTKWQDLAKPEYKNQVAMPSPLYSGAALIHLATLTEDSALGWQYYEKLSANGARPQGGNGGTFKAVASGDKPYGIVVDFLAIREKAKGSPVEFVFPQEGVSMVTEPVAIMAGAKNPENAQKFVDFVLSAKGQQVVLDQGYLPARNGMASPAGFPERGSIKTMAFNPTLTLKNVAENKKHFAKIWNIK